jgi:hypothetical protein
MRSGVPVEATVNQSLQLGVVPYCRGLEHGRFPETAKSSDSAILQGKEVEVPSRRLCESGAGIGPGKFLQELWPTSVDAVARRVRKKPTTTD